MRKPFKVVFPNGEVAHAVRVHDTGDLTPALDELGIRYPSFTVVLVGGAGGLSNADLIRLRPFFVETLAPLVQAKGALVLDGGTDAGVMRLMGDARDEIEGRFPLIGVAASKTVILPDQLSTDSDAAPLEPNHTHFVLVPGSTWGDESPWLACIATALSGGVGSAVFLVNGGETSLRDVRENVKAGHPVIVVNGTGRLADSLARAIRGEAVGSQENELVQTGLLHVIDLTESPDAVAADIEGMISTKG
jgi:hypothetical protein